MPATALLIVLAWVLWAPAAWSAEGDQAWALKLAKDRLDLLVAMDGVLVQPEPGVRSPREYPASFLSHWISMEQVEKDGKIYHRALRVDPRTGQIGKEEGWLDDAWVVVEGTALKSETGVHCKGLVAGTADGQGGREIPPVLGRVPGKDCPGGFLAFPKNFYFIFKDVCFPDGKRYCLLGNAPSCSPTNPEKVILGWIEEERLIRWDTRYAVEFDKGTLEKRSPHPAGIFATKEELDYWLERDTKGNGTPRPALEEDVTVASWPPMRMRFPLLQTDKSHVDPSCDPVYQVCYVGDQRYLNGAKGLRRELLENQKAGLERVRCRLSRLDFLFVMDSTTKTNELLPVLSNALNGVERLLEQRYGSWLAARYSVLFYRDYYDDDGLDDPKDTYLIKRCELSEGIYKAQTFIEDYNIYEVEKDTGKDTAEAVFWGMKEAVLAAEQEMDRPGIKALILLGDMGNHKEDTRGMNERDVAFLLKAKGYQFLAVQLIENDNELAKEAKGEAEDFRRQCQDIGRLMDGSPVIDVVCRPGRKPENVESILEDYTGRLAVAAARGREAIVRVLNGEGLDELTSEYGRPLIRMLKEMMLQEGVNPRLFNKPHIQVSGRGWVSRKDAWCGENQVKLVALFSRQELRDLAELLDNLSLPPPEGGKNRLQTWRRDLESKLGEINPDLALAKIIGPRAGITPTTPFLQRSLREICAMDDEALFLGLALLEQSAIRLWALLRGDRVEISCRQAPLGRWVAESRRMGTRNLWWEGPGGEYAWVPLEELP